MVTGEMIWRHRLHAQEAHDAENARELRRIATRSLPWLGYFARVFGLVEVKAWKDGGQ